MYISSQAVKVENASLKTQQTVRKPRLPGLGASRPHPEEDIEREREGAHRKRWRILREIGVIEGRQSDLRILGLWKVSVWIGREFGRALTHEVSVRNAQGRWH